MPVCTTDIDSLEGASISLEPGGQYDDVELVTVFSRLDTRLGDCRDGLAVFDINERDVVAIKGFVIAVIKRWTLGK